MMVGSAGRLASFISHFSLVIISTCPFTPGLCTSVRLYDRLCQLINPGRMLEEECSFSSPQLIGPDSESEPAPVQR